MPPCNPLASKKGKRVAESLDLHGKNSQARIDRAFHGDFKNRKHRAQQQMKAGSRKPVFPLQGEAAAKP